MSDWKGQRVRIAVFQNQWHAGRMQQVFVTRELHLLDTDTVNDLFDRFPPSDGYALTITPRRPGD
jgi:hypothetical protein